VVEIEVAVVDVDTVEPLPIQTCQNAQFVTRGFRVSRTGVGRSGRE
jgi:hypothetical protein